MAIHIIPSSGLDKIFLDTPPVGGFRGGSLLSGENYSFQFAFSASCVGRGDATWTRTTLRIDSDIADNLSLYLVKNVPVTTPTYARYDHGYLRHTPGLYPDPLVPLENGADIRVFVGRWQSVWVRVTGTVPPGKHTVRMTMDDASAEVELTVLAAKLPEQKLLYTNWLHCDCIADLHRCPIFSDDYWGILAQYFALAGGNGMNMVLVPAFTPPLDTPVGGERMTAQLVDVEKTGGTYRFGFEKLDKYLALAQENGITWFEHSHLFTQWGAKYAPKVMATVNGGDAPAGNIGVCSATQESNPTMGHTTVNGEYKRIFGWETDGTGDEYADFLRQYLDALIPHLKDLGVDRNFYYHISDEPWTGQQLENYRRAKEIVADKLAGYHFFEALSHYEFYEQGLVPTPVVATDAIAPFLGKTENLWAYYTGGQSFLYSNRLISMTSRRNRVLGMQMYKYGILGFLQWGFNFYYTTLSREIFDPMQSPDAHGEFTAGTCFQVYPMGDTVLPSLRLFVFHDALQDMAAFDLLEEKIGHQAVVDLLERVGGGITWTSCPNSDDTFLAVREAVNKEIEKLSDLENNHG